MARVTIIRDGITSRVPAALAQRHIEAGKGKLDASDTRGAEAYREFVGRNPPPKKEVKRVVKKKQKQEPPKV